MNFEKSDPFYTETVEKMNAVLNKLDTEAEKVLKIVDEKIS
jgi:hypothetical protein